MKSHGPWTICNSNEVYQDEYIRVRLDGVIRPDGLPGQHVVVDLKPGVCVLAVDDSNHVYLTREFHYGVGRESLEGVSGGREEGEDPLATARRELREELGLVADEWEPLASVDPFTTVVVSPTQLYRASRLREVAAAPEGTELITRVRLPLGEAVEAVRRGEITHGPTCIGLLWLGLWGGRR